MLPDNAPAPRCLGCGNHVLFIGYDDIAEPDPSSCTCGRPEGVCTCQVTLAQPFQVVNGVVNYDAHDGEEGAVIGEYTRIRCGVCRRFLEAAPRYLIPRRRP